MGHSNVHEGGVRDLFAPVRVVYPVSQQPIRSGKSCIVPREQLEMRSSIATTQVPAAPAEDSEAGSDLLAAARTAADAARGPRDQGSLG